MDDFSNLTPKKIEKPDETSNDKTQKFVNDLSPKRYQSRRILEEESINLNYLL